MKVAVLVLALAFISTTAHAKDCGWNTARQEPEIKVSYQACPEDRQGDKRLVSAKSEFKDGSTHKTNVVIDCKQYTYSEGDTYVERGGNLVGSSKSDERPRELLLHSSYREIAKRVCGK